MIKAVLIANRGEIASRIIRTCKKMGLRSVAVYSEADQHAEHVQLADEAYHIGGSRVHESYLNQDRVLEVAKQAKVDAIHPGYGLLSEQASFAENCRSKGFTFIGPSAEAIALMGDKLQARESMIKAGIPVVPGSSMLTTIEEAIKEANRIGYPVMLKAASGGGGIGIDLCYSDEDCRNAFEKNRKKATMFFGDSSLYIEKKIENPRHIEIQLLADHMGNVLTFGERDCSIQRRHQKVLEEAPATFLTEETQRDMSQMAIQAAQAIQYKNAGTIECLVDEDGMFYFLEMNTRLQVEHPVTEEIFDVDLVEWQIRIANGEQLPWKQNELKPQGHSIEVRIYAEDPIRFLPSPGTITDIKKPVADYIRHECPVKAGSVITPFYDPMIAKLIVTGTSREDAIAKLTDALQAYIVDGIKTNLPTLRGISQHPVFKSGDAQTSFIQQYGSELVKLEEEKK
ncbi:acetyl-CoA carboxylase biotin carboxylase subunit [Alkalihalobacillus xiaoxiensis]|uniref:biotin carboxylase n=1 Tax=Shouchella xiaoxiensis TaxID=766895 RepID=A0ABS2ST09_9BACI|nr:biotin carboxylase N-terminal domain-containing protein [Shouchella xiaoxiensis]MBM7837945.1 acetyl-CoA carboxylase biotin carboxylase subunit [Shouchella xiaoxiensis]